MGRRLALRTLAEWWRAGHPVLPRPSVLRTLSTPWYHDFSELGLPTPQRRGIYSGNQRSKAPTLFEFIDRSLELCPPTRGHVLELFCADGFFGCYAAQRGATRVVGIDIDVEEIAKARLAASALRLRNTRFEFGDVRELQDTADVVICAGGLYHLSDPEALLRRIRELTNNALVVQTVVSLANVAPNYFEAPAPGWSWGCRFSFDKLVSMLVRTNWNVQQIKQSELQSNDRPEDRGSAFVLCTPA